MKDTDFKKAYKDFETKVLNSLRTLVTGSKQNSKHVGSKAVKVNLANYEELVIINDRLTFLDFDGLHYDIFTNVTLEELIDILNT